MFVVLFHLCFDQISHELCKGRVWISFIPFPSSCDTNVFPISSNEALLYPGVSLELVPVGGDNPGEGVPADHKGDCLLELLDVSQFPRPRPEDSVESEDALVVGGVFNVGDKDPG